MGNCLKKLRGKGDIIQIDMNELPYLDRTRNGD